MDIANKDRFPHLYQLSKLGHFHPWERSEEYEKYLEEYNRELNNEYEIILWTSINRIKCGNNTTIHKIKKDECT